MNDQLIRQVRRVAVTDPIAVAQRYDYADTFEVQLPKSDVYSPEVWVRGGLAATPAIVARIVGLLGLRPASAPAPDRLSVFRIVSSDPELIHLEASVPMLHVALLGRNSGPASRTLTTVLQYKRPLLARLAWAVIGIAHRRVALRLITSKVATT